ncbi:hypothetical protein J416_04196 [Gracilibacillus halophilus YIM-C55.5]|uniref:DUF624 domain-containing protein n=1 Tax=Gracilibacillus halophilus YIM-C55.5 TaxID=1308866 RepID=N4WTQ1_9BACI|nr:YesL family protein [Gracilibacillus halophilus]ENH97735.1 hypothetical protein J416_04196 [Gracilibacillus halophilus YIM-C55.5]
MRQSLFAATEWIYRFAYVNILWMAFTIVGLGIFGLFPATVTMFTFIRKWLMGESDVPIFRQFWSTYKNEFLRSNMIGLVFYFFGLTILLNLQFMRMNEGSYSILIQLPLYMFIFIVIMTLIYVIPCYVHYDVRFRDIWKNAFFIMLIHPLHNAAMIIGCATLLYVMWLIPGSLFFFAGSAVAYIIMGTCYHAFQKVQEKKRQMET